MENGGKNKQLSFLFNYPFFQWMKIRIKNTRDSQKLKKKLDYSWASFFYYWLTVE